MGRVGQFFQKLKKSKLSLEPAYRLASAFLLAGGLCTGAAVADDKKTSAVIGVTPEGQTCFIGGAMRGIIAEPEAIVQSLKHKDAYTLVRLDKTRGEGWAVGAPERIEDGGDCESSYLQE